MFPDRPPPDRDADLARIKPLRIFGECMLGPLPRGTLFTLDGVPFAKLDTPCYGQGYTTRVLNQWTGTCTWEHADEHVLPYQVPE